MSLRYLLSWLPIFLVAPMGHAALADTDSATKPREITGAAARAPTSVDRKALEGASPELIAATKDGPIAAYKTKLLDIAFQAASKLPNQPHLKNRARILESIVGAGITLDQAAFALRATETIPNWRRGAGYADLAEHFAIRKHTELTQSYIVLAQRWTDANTGDDAQEWQRDHVRVKVASALAHLGDMARAREAAKGVIESEGIFLAEFDAGQVTAANFEDKLKAVDVAVKTANFDRLRAELETCAQLFRRFYGDAERRTLAEEKIRSSWGRIPVQVRVELGLELAGFALEHKDMEKGLALVKEARKQFDSVVWSPEMQAPLLAKIAAARHRAGETKEAKFEADGALAVYNAHRDRIVDIDRAGTLRQMAESILALGDVEGARKLYARAIDEGAVNPNGRPRVDDLSATCCSLALHGIEPDEKLDARIQEIFEGLAAPW